MRVLVVSDSYPPLIGGATMITQRLARELVDHGHPTLVVTSWQEGCASREHDGEIDVARIRAAASHLPGTLVEPRYTPPPFPDPALIVGFRRLIREFKPQVIHAYGWMAGSCAMAIAGSGIPLVIAARDYSNICARRTFLYEGETTCDGPATAKCTRCAGLEYGPLKGAVGALAVLGVRRTLRRRMSGLHSVSGYIEAVMEQHLVDDRRGAIRTIIAPDWRGVAAAADGESAALATLPDEPFILFVGALRRIKGVRELLTAYSSLRNPPPLVLIGTEAPDTPPIPSGVIVLRNLPQAAVMAAWRKALFGVAPSTLPEPLGNVVHEAMSVGKPVIGTKPGGHAEMISPNQDGLLVPAGDSAALATAMQQLIDDPALLERLGASAQAKAKRFERDAIVPDLIEFLAKFADEHAAPPQGPSRTHTAS